MLHVGNIKINRKCELKIICHSTPPSAAMAEVLWGTPLKIRVDLPALEFETDSWRLHVFKMDRWNPQLLI